MPTSFIVIPARLHSTRLARKLLLRETGKTVLQHTYESALRASRPSGICVATDHPEIVEEVERFGGRAVLTDPEAASGTDRVAEIAASMSDVEVFVNVQGDEPEIRGEAIDQVVALLEDNPEVGMSTLGTPIRDRTRLHDPACVKVVFNDQGRALYFSRSPIPHAREWNDRLLELQPAVFYQHLGLYAYRRDFLQRLAKLPPSRLEQLERLEQLRVLSAGFPIMVGVVDEPSQGIDTEADYRAFVSRYRNG